jgi:hypothetical protein
MEDTDLTFPTEILNPPITSGSIFSPEKNTLPRLPDETPFHNSYPPEEWAFADQARPDFEDEIVEREPFESSEPEENVVLGEEERQRILERIENSERVRERLGGRRHTFFGASLRESASKEGTGPPVEVLAYDYDQDTALVIRLRSAESPKIESIEQTEYLPPPTTEEAKRAIELARDSEELAGTRVAEMEAGVLRDFSHIPTSGGDQVVGGLTGEKLNTAVRDLEESELLGRIHANLGSLLGRRIPAEDGRFGRRRMDVRFRMPGERAPRYYALVDLTNRTVLEAGAVE